MRLHTSLTYEQVKDALRRAIKSGKVDPAVHILNFAGQVGDERKSQTHVRAFEIQLGADWPAPLPEPITHAYGRTQHVRRRARYGGWAASYREWGWFIAEVFAADANSRWGTAPKYDDNDGKRWGYFDVTDFHHKTDDEFDLD